MKYEACKHIIENFSVEARAKAIRAFVMDETQPYEQRLEIWRNTPDALQYKELYNWSHPEIDDDEWYGYDWWNRGQEVDLVDIPDSQDWDEEKTKEFYSGCMKEGIWAFKFDW